MNWAIYLIIAILLVFIPIPIKLTVNYTNNKLLVYLYRFRLNMSRRNKKKLKKGAKKSADKYKVSLSDIRLLLHEVDCLRFKPTLRMNINLHYGLFDACSTGVAYGAINSISPFVSRLLSIMFKVKKYDLRINPDFDKLMLEVSIKSIFFISLAKIMYIIVIMIKNIKFIKQKSNYACSNI